MRTDHNLSCLSVAWSPTRPLHCLEEERGKPWPLLAVGHFLLFKRLFVYTDDKIKI